MYRKFRYEMRPSAKMAVGAQDPREQRTENWEQSGGDLRLMGSCGLLQAGTPAVVAVGLDRCGGDTSVEVGHAVDEGTLGGDVVVVALGAREVEDEWRLLGLEFLLDGGESAEKSLSEIGEDGGAAS